ncbi:MAG TPA: PAS domain S-box protein [Dehalococcoidia bacterium]|nr:PAS domain S-box protein [Dehalococcoidia bacterium]
MTRLVTRLRNRQQPRRRLAIGLVPRIVGLVALTALVSGGLISYLGVRDSREALEKQILIDAQTQADLGAGLTHSYFESSTEPLTKIANAPYTRQALRGRLSQEMQTILGIVKASQPGFQNVSIYDVSGEVFARSINTAPATNVALREWFVEVRARRAPHVGQAVTNPASGGPIVPIAVPVMDEAGELMAVVVAALSLDAVSNALNFAEASKSARVTLVDQRSGGIVLAERDAARILQPISAGDDVTRALLSRERVARSTSRRDGERVLTAITPITDLPWMVMVDQSSGAAFASVNDLTRKTLIFGAAIILAGCLLSGLAVLQITRPLYRLRRAATGLAEGDLHQRLDFRQQDEVGELGRAFDSMAQSLETAVGELRSAHDELEVRVQERTSQLAAANLELKDSEERFRLLVNGLQDYALFLLDSEGRVASWNLSGERIMGYSEQEVIGQHCSLFYTPESRDSGDPEAQLERAREEGSSLDEQWRIRKDGSSYWASILTTALFDEAGGLKGYSKLVRDMTEQRDIADQLARSHEHFRSIVELSPEGIVIADAQGQIRRCNNAAARMFGYEADVLAGMRVEDLLPTDLRGAHLDRRQSYLSDPRPRAMGENLSLRGMRSDASEFFAEVSLTPLQTAEGLFVAATITDVTAAKEAEEELERRAAELARSNEELEQFAYVASHDLQEPLRMVSNYTQLLGRRYRGKLDEDADAFIGFAVEGAQRMQQLINDLLEFSRVGSKGKEFELVDTDVSVNRVLANLQVALGESGARIERTPLPSVLADEAQLVQLLQNLIGNAIKFQGDHAPVIEIGAEAQGNRWLFWVRDNGIGIDPEYFERIFVLFQRLHSREDYAGTGIGLAVCKRIVERHGGRIWAESQPGKGTTFFFTLGAAGAEETPVRELVAGEAA